MIRLDVQVSAADFDQGIRYYIPSDNPFSSDLSCTVGCPEIYAWGFRNPWRWSFDRLTGQLWVGDVGQNAIEEISLAQLGGNHGWRCYEGDQTYNTSGCDLGADFVEPVHTYTHSVGNSVTGGYVYRGEAYPQLHGMYIFTDFGSGTIWGLFEGDYAGVLTTTSTSPVSVAENLAGEIYFVSLPYSGSPKIMRLDIN
ncbi:MAG: hypothetical protein HKN70_04435 [Gammaproteobacteria bacterium]|nr:hypothetical protein [Gammaproteobacteria bacterium]